MEQICKPNFVFALKSERQSFIWAICCQTALATYPKTPFESLQTLSGQLIKSVFLFGLAPRGVYPAAPVAKRADALLPRRFTHHPFGLVCFLLHLSSFDFIKKSNARTLSGSPPFGVRTFLSSILQKAIAQSVPFARLEYLNKNCSTFTI